MNPLAAVGLIDGALQVARSIFGGQSNPKMTAVSSFQQVLDATKQSFGPSGLSVTTESGLEVDLSASQMERLARLTDDADARGVTSLLVQHGSTAYVVDVARRTIVTKSDATSPPPIRVDGFASLDETSNMQNPVSMLS